MIVYCVRFHWSLLHGVQSPLTQLWLKWWFGRRQAITWTNVFKISDTIWNHLTHPPSAAYMRQWIGSALVQVMACRLFGAKPLPEPMLAYSQLNSWEQISMKFESESYHFRSRKCIWNYRLRMYGGHFVEGRWVYHGGLGTNRVIITAPSDNGRNQQQEAWQSTT